MTYIHTWVDNAHFVTLVRINDPSIEEVLNHVRVVLHHCDMEATDTFLQILKSLPSMKGDLLLPFKICSPL